MARCVVAEIRKLAGGPRLAPTSSVLASIETAIAFIIIIGVVLYPLSLPAPEEERT
jgi:hypothetical protein